MAEEFKPIRISNTNYGKLSMLKQELFAELQNKGVYRNVDFDDVITSLLIEKEERTK